jgi:hypothetical protein
VAGQNGLERRAAVVGVQAQQPLLDGQRHQPRQLGGLLAGRELHEHPRHRAHPQLAVGADLVRIGVVPAPMNHQTLARPSSCPRDRHLDLADIDCSQLPDCSRRPVAQEGARSERQRRPEEAGTVTQTRVADREHVVMEPVQPAVCDAIKDLVIGEP